MDLISGLQCTCLLEIFSVNELHEPVRHAAGDEAVVGGDAKVEDWRGELDGVHLTEDERK